MGFLDPKPASRAVLDAAYASKSLETAVAGKADASVVAAKLDKTEAAATYATPATVEAQVPPLVSQAMAEDSTIADAGVTAVNNAASGLSLVQSTDPRIPRQATSVDYLYALRDSAGNLTDLAISASDGQFAQFVIDRLTTRIAKAQRTYADTTYKAGATIFPFRADTKRVAGWGSSSMEYAVYPFATLFESKGATYFNGGKAGEWGEHIVARMGAVPALLSVAGGNIPASGPVDVTASNMPIQLNMKTFSGTLNGVAGSLAYATPGKLVFTRTTSGAVTAVTPDTPLLPDAASYRDATVLLWIGKNNIGNQAGADTNVIKLTDAAFDWLAPLAKRALVLGHFADSDTPATGTKRDQILAINTAYANRYGNLYVDVSAYITSPKIWTDMSIAPTQADLDAQAIGNKAPSLSSDNSHFTDAANQAIATNLIAPRLTALGWY